MNDLIILKQFDKLTAWFISKGISKIWPERILLTVYLCSFAVDQNIILLIFITALFLVNQYLEEDNLRDSITLYNSKKTQFRQYWVNSLIRVALFVCLGVAVVALLSGFGLPALFAVIADLAVLTYLYVYGTLLPDPAGNS